MPSSHTTNRSKSLRVGSRLGKYRIERRIGEGAFAAVYRAFDTLEGQRVALKVPHGEVFDADTEADFHKEIRLAARLRHPRVLPLKSADYIDGRLVLVYPLGEKTLDDRLRSRISVAKSVDYFEQLLEALACAHDQRVIHCDVKPENLILIDGELMLADFGIARVALRTIRASGSGTIGYCAPEQAMGKPSFRSDVFAAGLVGCRMFTGQLPEWPFAWPPPGVQRLRRLHPDLTALLRRSIELDPRKRFANAGPMLAALRRLKPKLTGASSERSGPSKTTTKRRDWKSVQWREFQKRFGKQLETRHECHRCRGPVSEPMQHCPWCGVDRRKHHGETTERECCPRCNRGLKPDWRYCPWCYGPGFEVTTSRTYQDNRYAGRCTNGNCTDRRLMPFMRYCPWCRTKVRRKWKLKDCSDTCGTCGQGVAGEYWSYCPWCGKTLSSKQR